ncbi:MAG: hypothetical protein M3Z64_09615 [Verrucomicrobiota bacterium]|nr:hypothetical protein [Verrucomicrobiota bacterium]
MSSKATSTGIDLRRGTTILFAALLAAAAPHAMAQSALNFFQPFGRLLNISTRARVGAGDNVLIAGFTIVGTAPKKIIVRALGPSLEQFGVNGALPDAALELHDASGALLATNENWKNGQRDEIEAEHLAPSDDREAALIRTLEPGAYTAIVRGSGDTTGVALVEVYDGDGAGGASVLANVSTRAFTSSGSPIIGGVIVSGEGVPFNRIVVRAIGPTLRTSGIQHTLDDPTLELRDADGALIQENDDWEESARSDTLEDRGLAPSDEHEAAVVGLLGPGAFTAIVRGSDDSAGAALVEFYQIR